MARYRKILVACDGSESSKNALRQAITLAQGDFSRLRLLAVVPRYEGDLNLAYVKDVSLALRGPAEKVLSEAEAIAREAGADAVTTSVEEGEAFERIVFIAEDQFCDLIVLGRLGRRPMERALMGYVTARVVGLSRMDILVVPAESRLDTREIVVPTDGSGNSMAAARKAVEFAAAHGSSLHAVSALDMNEEFYAMAPELADRMAEKAHEHVKAVADMAAVAGLKCDASVRAGLPHHVVIDTVKRVGAGCVFMGSHGRTGLNRLLMGSVAEQVIGRAPCPVFVIKS